MISKLLIGLKSALCFFLISHQNVQCKHKFYQCYFNFRGRYFEFPLNKIVSVPL